MVEITSIIFIPFHASEFKIYPIIPVETKGGSDAGFLNYVGIETFCLGDGGYISSYNRGKNKNV